MVNIYTIGKGIKVNTKDILKEISNMELFFNLKLKGNLDIYIFNDRSFFNKRLGKIKTPKWHVANASNSGEEIDILSPNALEKESSHKRSEFMQLINHELTHIFLYKKSKGSYIPKWLDEGLACYYAKQENKKRKLKIEKLFCKRMSSREDWENNINSGGYYISSKFVSLLISKYGVKKILKLITILDNKYSYTSFKEKFYKIYKEKLEKVEIDFIRTIQD